MPKIDPAVAEKRKADRAEAQKRTDAIHALILSGWDSGRIVQYAADKWNLAARQTRTYIKRANDLIAAAGKVDRAEQYRRAVARYELLFGRAFALQDYKTCLSISRALNDLMRLSPPVDAASVALTSPGDVLAILQAELNAALTGSTTPERTAAVERLATASLRTIEANDLAERIAALEKRINE